MSVTLPAGAEAAFHACLAALAPGERETLERVAAEAPAPVVAASRHWDFTAPARAADQALASAFGGVEDRLRRGLAARWALDLPVRVASLHLPAAIEALYPAAVDVLARTVAEAGAYDADYWAKDVRAALALTVPCGAQVVDLYARLGPGEVLRDARARGDWRGPFGYLAAQGWGPWVQIHTESRATAEFTPEGWDACYRRVAALLESRPALRGMIGSSWFYDPPLKAISPRLAYLQERPLAEGAFLVRQGSDPLYTARATQTSPTRRRLVEEGRYTPCSWLLTWPRAGLIRWARRR